MTQGPDRETDPGSGGLRLTPLQSALKLRCPRCGEGRLFSGALRAAPVCAHCGLELARYDAGDGPAFIVSFLAGLAAILDVALMFFVFHATYLVTAGSAVAVTLIVTALGLPRLKAWLIAQAIAKGARGS